MRKTRNEKSGASTGRRRTSSSLTIGLGVSIIVLTLLVSVVGVRTAVSSMRAASDRSRFEYERLLALRKAEQNSKEFQDLQTTAKSEEPWTSPQIEWMLENHITWDENGCPVNEDGVVVDDPTTKFDETARPIPENTPPQEQPESAGNWWDGNAMIQQDEAGNLYYVVNSGDSLSRIANSTGFTVPELADYNNIQNASMINVGQHILFPAAGPSVLDKSAGLG